MSVIHIISGPVIGAVIGYFTNYIAVKMLFRPYYPIKAGRFTLPFTPGIIPRRKNALAEAVGRAVGSSLLGEGEIKQILLSRGVKEAVSGGALSALSGGKEEVTVKNLAASCMSSETYEVYKAQLVDYITDKAAEGIDKIELGNVIATQGAGALKGMDLGVMAMFINDNTIAAFAKPMGDKITAYIKREGRDKIRTYIYEEVCKGEEKDLRELGRKYEQIDIKQIIEQAYTRMIDSKADDIVKEFHIAETIREKIQNMGVKELEELVLSVMKNELNMIVNLGALIGFVIGLLNILL